MRLEYGKFWQMCIEKGIKPSFFYEDEKAPYFLSKSTVYEMQHNRPVALQTIDKICTFFKCQPCDIMEFVND